MDRHEKVNEYWKSVMEESCLWDCYYTYRQDTVSGHTEGSSMIHRLFPPLQDMLEMLVESRDNRYHVSPEVERILPLCYEGKEKDPKETR
jgi:hypothetical protein